MLRIVTTALVHIHRQICSIHIVRFTSDVLVCDAPLNVCGMAVRTDASYSALETCVLMGGSHLLKYYITSYEIS